MKKMEIVERVGLVVCIPNKRTAKLLHINKNNGPILSVSIFKLIWSLLKAG